MPWRRASLAACRSCSSLVLRWMTSRMRWLAPSLAVVRIRWPPLRSAATRSSFNRSARSDDRPTSRPESARAFTTSVISGWSVVAAPTRPTFFASSGINDRMPVLLDDAHAVVRGTAHHAIRAAAVAAALGLDQEHVAELGVWRDDLREGGEGGGVRLVDGRQDVAVHARHEHVRLTRQATHGAVLRIRAEDHVECCVHRLVGLAHDHRIDERGERQRIAEGQRPAREDERVLLGAVFCERRDACQLQRLNQPGELGLVRDRHRDHRVVGDRPQLLIRDQRHPRLPPSLEVVGQKRAVRSPPFRSIDRPINGLIPERRHPDAIRTRIQERDRLRSILVDAPISSPIRAKISPFKSLTPYLKRLKGV